MKYSGYLYVALDIQNAIPMRHIFICGLYGSAILFHNIPQRAGFSKKSFEYKMYVLLFYTPLV
jgi:hypothetical protein